MYAYYLQYIYTKIEITMHFRVLQNVVN